MADTGVTGGWTALLRAPVLAVALIVVAAGCTTQPASPSVPSSSVSVSSSDSASPEDTASPTGSASPGESASPGDSASPGSSASPGDSASPGSPGTPGSNGSGPPILGEEDRELVLADAFAAGQWTEGDHTKVGETQTQPALALEVACRPAKDGGDILQFRFSGAQGRTLDGTFSHDITSPNAKAALQFTVRADDQQVVDKTLRFKETSDFSVNLNGVAVVEIQVRQARTSGTCQPATALITELRVEAA